jgi:hypothetical protein
MVETKWLDFSILCSDMWVDTDVSEECASSIFRGKKLESTLALQ